MTLVEQISNAVHRDAKPAVIMGLAADLVKSVPFGPLTLMRLGHLYQHDQLMALAVFHAASGPLDPLASLFLHATLSRGKATHHVIARTNMLSIASRIAAEQPYSFEFNALWFGWFIYDCLGAPETADDAVDTLHVIADTRAGGNFMTLNAATRIAERLVNEGFHRSDLEASAFLPHEPLLDGREYLTRQIEELRRRHASDEDVSFVSTLRANAYRDLEVARSTLQRGVDTIVARVGWMQPGNVLRWGQDLLGLMETITQPTEIHDYAFASGSFVVTLRTSGAPKLLPKLDDVQDADHPKVDRSVRNRLAPLLAAVSVAGIDLSVQHYPGNGRRPTTWSPTKRQAAVLLETVGDVDARDTVERVVLRGTDPDAAGTGYARLQFYGQKETFRAVLKDKYVTEKCTINEEYVAHLTRTTGETGAQWQLNKLLTPTEAAEGTHIEAYKATQVPRVADLSRLLAFLRIVDRTGNAHDVVPMAFGVRHKTTVQYWTHFAQTIDAIDGTGKLTLSGSLALDGGEVSLAKLFAQSHVAAGLLRHSRKDQFAQVTEADCRAFVEECVGKVSGTSIDQRCNALFRLVQRIADLR